MQERDRDAQREGGAGPTDQEIAADAAAMGESGISQATGTGGPGSGLGTTRDGGIARTGHPSSTGPATNDSDDLIDAAGPSGLLEYDGRSAEGGPGTPDVP